MVYTLALKNGVQVSCVKSLINTTKKVVAQSIVLMLPTWYLGIFVEHILSTITRRSNVNSVISILEYQMSLKQPYVGLVGLQQLLMVLKISKLKDYYIGY